MEESIKTTLLVWLRAWWPQLIPAFLTTGFVFYWLWPAGALLSLSLALFAGVLVFFFMTFVRMAAGIND